MICNHQVGGSSPSAGTIKIFEKSINYNEPLYADFFYYVISIAEEFVKT